MPVILKQVTLQLMLLPIELRADGSCLITVRKGYPENGDFIVCDSRTIEISPNDTQGILDCLPTPGLTRKDDLAFAVYTYLVNNNHIEAGTIS